MNDRDLAAGFRGTHAQDRPLARAPLWRRRPALVAVALAAIVALASLAPAVRHMLSAGTSVSRSRVRLATVERGPFVRDIAADGRVVATVSPTVYAPAAGAVRFAVNAGQRVAEGDVLGTVESPELTSKLAQETAALEGMRVDRARAELDARQHGMVAERALEQARIERDAASTEADRNRKAFDLGVVPEIDVLRAQAALAKAEVAFERAATDRGLEAEGRKFDVDAKRLAVERQELAVADLKRQSDLLTLRSPVLGQVGQLLIADRATVAKDAPLMTVVDLRTLEVEIQVPESFARDLAVGMAADVSGGGEHLPGEVSAVSPEVVRGEVAARVRFTGAVQGLRQNQRLSVRIVLDRRSDVRMVERGPFVESGGGAWAYVVRDDVAERRPIRLGAASLEKVEVLEGLEPGDEVVISGSDAFGTAERVVLGR